MKKILKVLQAAAICLSVLCIASCGRPPIPEETTTAAPETTTTTTAATTTTTAPPETTTTIATTLPPPTTEAETEAEPDIPLEPVPAGIPGKYYAYNPPSFKDLTLNEKVDYRDDGRIVASTHENKDGFESGFIIDYIPGSYLTVLYTTDTSYAAYAGKQSMIDLDLSEDNYGRVYIGETVNGFYDGEGYLFWEYSDPECGWYSYTKGSPNGLGYSYDGAHMYLEEYEEGSVIAAIEVPMTVNSADEDVYVMSVDDGLEFYVSEYDELFQVGGVPEYFGSVRFDESSYRGQIVNGDMWGPGVYVWDDGDVLIGHFEDGDITYGYFYVADDSSSYFIKNVDGEWETIEELDGIDIDFADAFGLN